MVTTTYGVNYMRRDRTVIIIPGPEVFEIAKTIEILEENALKLRRHLDMLGVSYEDIVNLNLLTNKNKKERCE